jgi:hypothetical protein
VWRTSPLKVIYSNFWITSLKIEFEKFIIIQQWFLNMNFIGIISANFKQQLLLIEIKENMNIHHLQFCYNYIYMLQPMWDFRESALCL